MKILLTLTTTPDNINPSQLFDSQEHLDIWVEDLTESGILTNVIINGVNFTSGQCSGLIEEKPDEFQN